jgi:predicted Zn-dependent protease
MVSIVLCGAMGMLLLHTANAGTATKEEIDAAVKFYEEVKADSNKLNAYCEVKQAIGMMASRQGNFAEAQQKASTASKQMGPEFAKAQGLQTRLDIKSEDTARYTAARQALDKDCP